MQRHEFSIELSAPPEDVWEVFWYRGPDRPQPKDVRTVTAGWISHLLASKQTGSKFDIIRFEASHPICSSFVGMQSKT